MGNKIYCILALTVLAFFYGIYFAKMSAQKRIGIRTNQIGRRKEKQLHTVETLMSIATVGVVAAQLISVAREWNYMSANARLSGFCLGAMGDIIFLLAVLQMKNSWRVGIPERDKTKLVTNGIYRFSRNPAFLGFDFMYLGMLLMYFNCLSALFTVFAALMLHLQILQEEKYLAATFGEEYLAYKAKTFRYLGIRK